MTHLVVKQFGPSFAERLVSYAQVIPAGRVTTYGHLARAAGGRGQAARSVSAILSRAEKEQNIQIPWHRIVYAGGTVWFGTDREKARRKLYAQEGIEVNNKGRITNFSEVLYTFE